MHRFIRSTALIVFAFYFQPANSRHVIDDSPISKDEIIATVQLMGTRIFPIDAFKNSYGTWALDPTILYRSATNDDDFLKILGTPAKVDTLTVRQLASIYKNLPPNDLKLSDRLAQIPGTSGILFDPAFVRSLTKSDALLIDEFVPIGSTSTGLSWGLAVEGRLVSDALMLYGKVDTFSQRRVDPITAFAFAKDIEEPRNNLKLAAASQVVLAEIDLGRPYVFTGIEKGIKVEPSILKESDVYLIQFAINPTKDLRHLVRELSLFILLNSDGAELIDMAPLRYGDEQTIRSRKSIPEIETRVGPNSFRIGSPLESHIEIKSLKPTIVGTGLQSSRFGWSLFDDMIDMSAKRLIALIRVPKATKTLGIDLMLTARTKQNIVQRDVSVSKPYTTTLVLTK